MCVYACMHVCMHVCVCVCVCVCDYTYACMCVCMTTRMHVCMSLYMCMYSDQSVGIELVEFVMYNCRPQLHLSCCRPRALSSP